MPSLRDAYLRHARYFLNLLGDLEACHGYEGESFERLFRVFWPQIDAAWAWAEGLAQEDPEASKIVCDFPSAGGDLLRGHLDSGELLRRYRIALTTAGRLGDVEEERAHLNNIGLVYLGRHAPDRAAKFFARALRVARRVDDGSVGVSIALRNLGCAYLDLRQPERAARLFIRALRYAQDPVRHKEAEAIALANLGAAFARMGGRLGRAVRCLRTGLVLAKEFGDTRLELHCLRSLGRRYAESGDLRRSRRYQHQALRVAHGMGDDREECHVLVELGNAALGSGKPRRALKLYEQAMRLRRAAAEHEVEGVLYRNISLALKKLGRKEEAIGHAQAALRLLEGANSPEADKVRRALAAWAHESVENESSSQSE